MAEIAQSDSEVDAQWTDYMATYLDPEEKPIAERIGAALTDYRAVRQRVTDFIRSGDMEAASISEISRQVERSQSVAGRAGEEAVHTTELIRALSDNVGKIGEIARNVEQAAVGTQEVSGNIAVVEQAARETGEAATQIRDSSAELSKQAEYLRQRKAA